LEIVDINLPRTQLPANAEACLATDRLACHVFIEPKRIDRVISPPKAHFKKSFTAASRNSIPIRRRGMPTPTVIGGAGVLSRLFRFPSLSLIPHFGGFLR
jgi:hypothetical protein